MILSVLVTFLPGGRFLVIPFCSGNEEGHPLDGPGHFALVTFGVFLWS